MMGKIAFDRLDYAAASGHFTEMQELGKILNDVDIQALALIHQGDLLRKRRRYELAFRCLEVAQPYADAAAPGIQGLRYIILARGFYCFGDEQKFLRTIDIALHIAKQITTTIDNLANQFTLDDVLQEQAAGFTTLWHPEKALEIYQEMDRLHPTRPLREQGSYIIDKAQAYFHLGDLDHGLKLSLQGIELAQEYRSPRHIMRLDTTYDRLLSSPLGKETQMKDFQEVLINAHRAEKFW